jgi:hypothetical protein
MLKIWHLDSDRSAHVPAVAENIAVVTLPATYNEAPHSTLDTIRSLFQKLYVLNVDSADLPTVNAFNILRGSAGIPLYSTSQACPGRPPCHMRSQT